MKVALTACASVRRTAVTLAGCQAVALLFASGAHGDLTRPSTAMDAYAGLQGVVFASALDQSPLLSLSPVTAADAHWGGSEVGTKPVADGRPAESPTPLAQLPASEPDSAIHSLPPPPGSAACVLSGLLTLGLWGAGRSAKNLHLGALPTWYHAEGPHQVGHAVAFDFDGTVLPVCQFDLPSEGRILQSNWLHLLELTQPRSSDVITPAGPRAPPRL